MKGTVSQAAEKLGVFAAVEMVHGRWCIAVSKVS
jgi:hypothetical protein